MAWSSLPTFPSDDGWPYPDLVDDPAAVDDIDLDALELRVDRHAFDDLTDAEHRIVSARFGLAGPPRSMRDACNEVGCTRAEGRALLGSALGKLRARLTA